MFGAHLKSADQGVGNIILEELFALVVLAAPAPDVLTISTGSASLQHTCCNAPHDKTEHEGRNGKVSVVDGSFLGSPVTSSPVIPENCEAES